ncbi:hypothetical protein ANN_07187 [Periplaneta americana]|uniref:Transposase n=1 Tax=Periplaneta americana TaxID=6978 RepID=A0ABQ8TI00_PERAM|nr:hypothetical protein ANN_07187 [Periplaneta americana]
MQMPSGYELSAIEWSDVAELPGLLQRSAVFQSMTTQVTTVQPMTGQLSTVIKPQVSIILGYAIERELAKSHGGWKSNTVAEEDTPLINRQHIHFLHDGAPAHFNRTARRYLDRRFPDGWIGRGGPIAWPPRSPDLNPLDFYLWGHLKSLVYSSPVPDLESLRNRIVACSEDICNTPGVWDRVRRSMRHRCEVCIQAGGGHFEHLL